MSFHQFYINRDQAELLVDLLEENFRLGKKGYTDSGGEGVDLASELRRKFGMIEQPEIKYGELDI